jgi:hypothetical protein
MTLAQNLETPSQPRSFHLCSLCPFVTSALKSLMGSLLPLFAVPLEGALCSSVTPLEATLTKHPASVHSKGLAPQLSRLEATLMKNIGVGVLLLTRNPKRDFYPERPSGVKDLSLLTISVHEKMRAAHS